MPNLIRGLVLVTTIVGALAAPQAALADCVGERRNCMHSAMLEYNDCNVGCSYVGCFYVCEWLHDADKAGCWSEYVGCINPLW